jgi:hypothetical protein
MHLSRTFYLSGAVATAIASYSFGIPALAATPVIATRILLSDAPVAYPGSTVIRGTLVQASDQQTPIAGKTIDLTLETGNRAILSLGHLTTAADGTFTLTTTLPALGWIKANFTGDSTYATWSTGEYTHQTLLPTRVTLEPLPATVKGLSYNTVHGNAQVQAPDGTWMPAADTNIAVHGDNQGNYQSGHWDMTTTDTNGRFTVDLGITDPGPYHADTQPSWYSYAGTSTSPGVQTQITPAPTYISGFAATQPAIAQNGLIFSAHVDGLRTGSNGLTSKAGYDPAHLFFRATGTTTWTDMGTAPTYNPDLFTIYPSAYLPSGKLAEGSWQLRILPSPIVQATASNIITVDVKTETWLNHPQLTNHHLTGILDDQPTSGPLTHQTVKLYFRYRGGKAWHYSGSTTTDLNGTFSLTTTNAHRWYRVVFPTGTGYWGVVSPSFYLPR